MRTSQIVRMLLATASFLAQTAVAGESPPVGAGLSDSANPQQAGVAAAKAQDGAGGDSIRKVELIVDGAKTGAVISPYLYGQFMEHMGRCIRDGIWAEKLNDRKFLLPPGKSWEIVKPEGAKFDAFHDPAGAYAGDHCLALWLRGESAGPCGIRQGKIGLIAGKEYVGYAILASVGAAATVDIRLSNAQSVTLTDVGPAYRKYEFRFKADTTTEDASLAVTIAKPAYVWVGAMSLMPADNVKGMRADVLPLIRQLAPPIIRWPGGNFVSGYNWKDGIGDRDRRPPRWERAWEAVEDNDFGIDEFMAFCAEVGTEAYIAVNTGLGSVEDACDELDYVNGSPTTRWGAERGRNGHVAPYGVIWWGIGNEMYGNWQLGAVPADQYALRHNAFVDAMRGRDPKIKVIACGHPGKWNDTIVPGCAKHMDMLSGHFYGLRKFHLPFAPADAAAYRANFPTYSDHVAVGLRNMVNDFRSRKPGAVKLSADEWGIVREWGKPAHVPDSEGVGIFEHYFCLGDAIAIARGVHELLRSADVVGMANWSETVNVVGAIKTTRNHAVLDAVGHVLALYRSHLGGRLVPLAVPGGVPLDAVAASDGKSISIALINYSTTDALQVTLKGTGRKAVAWRIGASDLGAFNVPGQPEAVRSEQLKDAVNLDAPVILPAHSITVLKGLSREQER